MSILTASFGSTWPSAQIQALEDWKQVKGRGTLVLPIRGVQTLLSLRAIHAISSSTVILVPTVQVLSQWYELLAHAFHMEIGLCFSVLYIFR